MEFDPFSRAFFEDPYEIYRHLRDEEPAYHNPRLDFWALSRFGDVVEASIDWQTYTSTKGVTVKEMDTAMLAKTPMMIMMDPPGQVRLRKLISKVFTPRAIAELEPVIRELARTILEPLAEAEEFDVLTEFAEVLPTEVISSMLGVPEADRQQIRHWLDAGLTREEGNPDITPAGIEAMLNLGAYWAELVAERKRRPQDDMISHFIQVELRDEKGELTRLTDGEIQGFTGLISGAGNETVTKLLGNAMVLLHRHPEQRVELVGSPEAIPDAVEECLRYWPPSQIQGRSSTREVELHGRRIPAGARVLLMTGAACRDERAFEDADRFDIHRKIPLQLALGHGAHKCLGAALARLESRVSLEEILQRFPDYEVDEARTERVHMSNVAGYSSVPIRTRSAS